MEVFTWYVMAVNIFAFVLFGIDKERAKRNLWRISEKTLLLAALLGGAPGALAGMYFFHHKTRKPKFSVGVPVILAVQLFLVFVMKQYMGIDFWV